MSDNVFSLDAHRRKKSKKSTIRDTSARLVREIKEKELSAFTFWWNNDRLTYEPFVVRATVANVMVGLRGDPKSYLPARQHMSIVLEYDLLTIDRLTPDEFIALTQRAASTLMGRVVYVAQTSDSARTYLTYSITPSNIPPLPA